MGDDPVKDILWWVGGPPMGADQDLQNLIKAINAFRTGTIVPEELKKACADLDIAAFTNELRRIIERDGCEFVGAIKDCGVTLDLCVLTGPKTRDLPSQYNTEVHIQQT